MIDIEQRKQLIQTQAIFAGLTDKELTDLAKLFFEKIFAKNESVVIEGSEVDSIHIIISGKVEVRHARREGAKFIAETITTLGPGGTVGLNEKGFYSASGKRTATVVALKETHTLVLSFSRFHQFLKDHPNFNKLMHKYIKYNLGIVL